MQLTKKIIYTIVLLSTVLILNFIGNDHVLAGNLVVSAGRSHTLSHNVAYDQITINGILYINHNNLTITANNLTINAGGKITYTNHFIGSNSMTLNLNVNNNAIINGTIDFTGKVGNNGKNGTKHHWNGYTGGTGHRGKNIRLNVGNKLTINGVINVTGGTGGRGGHGHDDDDFWTDPIGNGGTGGKGGSGGAITIEAKAFLMGRNSKLESLGGQGGQGGNGGGGGTFGRGGRGGNGGTGGTGGTIKIIVNHLNRAAGCNINYRGGSGGPRGFGRGGSAHGQAGSGGQAGRAYILYGYGSDNGSYNPANPDKRSDQTPPFVTNFDLYITKNGTQLRENIIINDHTPLLKWSKFIDQASQSGYGPIPASGLKHYIVSLASGEEKILLTANENLMTAYPNPLADGDYNVQIKAKDHNGNESNLYPDPKFSFTIDTIRPNAPSLAAYHEGDITPNKILIRWTPAIDSSGIAAYVIKIVDLAGNPLYDTPIEVAESDILYDANNQATYQLEQIIPELAVNKEYIFRIFAKDRAGNISENAAGGAVVTPPATSSIQPVSSGWDSTNHRYFINLNLKAVGSGAEEYRYIRKKEVNGSWEDDYTSPWFSATTSSGNFSEQDHNRLAAHTNYQYYVETKNSSAQYGWDYAISNASETIAVANQLPIYPDPDNTNLYPQNNRFINQNNIALTISEFTDIEQDMLSYQFYLDYYNQEHDNWVNLVNGEPGTVNSGLVKYQTGITTETQYRWYVEVGDRYDQVSTTDLTGDYFYFTLDTTIIPPSLKILNPDDPGENEITAINNPLIKLKIWNVSSEIAEITVYENDRYHAAITIDGSQTDYYQNIFLDETEEINTIKLVVADPAGNTATTEKRINYDITAPEKPAGLSMMAGPGPDQVAIKWEQASDQGESASGVSGYLLSYPGAPNIALAHNSTAYIISGLGFNQQITVNIMTLDQAGNQSINASASCFTYSEPGRITGYNFAGHDLTLNIAGVDAAQYRIKRDRLNEQGAVEETAYSEWIVINQDELIYTETNLKAHRRYNYYIQTRNSEQIQDYNLVLTPFLVEVPNQPPTVPAIDADKFQYINNIFLSTNGSTDRDGDPLTYYFTIKDESDNILLEKGPATGSDGKSYQASFDIINQLNSGDMIKWKVLVTDGYTQDQDGRLGYVESPEISSTYDSERPGIEITTVPPNLDLAEFQLAFELDIKVSDQLSGLKSVDYYWNQEDLLPEQREITTENITEGIAEYRFRINELPVGTNNLYLVVSDQAGNEWQEELTCKLDKTPPLIEQLTITGQDVDGKNYTTSSNSISAEWVISEDFTDIANYSYAVVTENELATLSSLPADRFTKVQGVFAKERVRYAQTALLDNLQENETYYFVVEAANIVGLDSGLAVGSGVTIDSRPPEISEVTLNNLITANNKHYLNDLKQLSAATAVSDHGGSGVKEIKYALEENLSGPEGYSWYAELDQLVRSKQIQDGRMYYLVVKAIDRLNQENSRYSAGVIIDQSAPVINQLIVGSLVDIDSATDTFTVKPGQRLPLSFELADQVEINKISYALGTSPGSNDITQSRYPDSDGWIELANTNKKQQLNIAEELSAGRYYLNLKAENVAGLSTSSTSNPIQVDPGIKAAPTVYDAGIYTAIAQALSFSWRFTDAPMEIAHYQYQVIDQEKNILINWQDIPGDKGRYTVDKIELSQGQTYFVKLKAVFSNGTYSAVGTTDGITVDTSYPEDLYIDDQAYTPSDRLYLEWGATDQQSGIVDYQIKIGSTVKGDDLSDGWLELDPSGSRLIEGLLLPAHPANIYYVTLRVTNGAGLTKEITSNGFRVDNTCPPVPVVNDRLDYIKKGPLNFDWSQSAIDPESGLQEYRVALLTKREASGDLNWLNVGTGTEREFNDGLLEGQWYYLAVKAINRAGLVSEVAYSDGILIDSSAPDLILAEEEKQYVEIGEKLTIKIEARDQQSGIRGYQYCVGTREHPAAKIPWTAVELVNGSILIEITEDYTVGERYYLKVRAYNQVEDELMYYEGSSNGFMVTSGYPVITEVKDYGDYTPFNDQLVVSWQCDNPGYAPIKYYQVELSTDRSNWIAVKNTAEKQTVITPAEIGLDSLVDGQTYYVSIRGVNQANKITPAAERGITDGIRIDSTPPESEKMRIIHSDQYTTEQYKVDLQASDPSDHTPADPHSGISAYKFAVGTAPGGTDITDGWFIRETKATAYQEYFNFPFKHKQRYFLSFYTRNNTGLWSEMVTDQGVIADLTPPAMLSLSAESDYITASRQVVFNWQAEDPETGIANYRYQIVDSATTEVDWTGVDTYPTEANAGQVTFSLEPGLIEEGAKYKLALAVKNRLGVWSVNKFSQELTIDTIAPGIEITDHIITNGEQKNLDWTINEPATVAINLYRQLDTSLIPVDSQQKNIADPTNPQTYHFTVTEPATYQLELTATDYAGNQSTTTINLRVNARPEVTIQGTIDGSISVYKGRELKLTAAVNDPDGEETAVQYQWDFGDGKTASERLPVHRYTETGTYTLTLSCTDNDGGIGTDSIEIIVTNTLEGSLVLDETWSGEMILKDTVTVPAGRSLIVEKGTLIRVPAGQAVKIEGSLVINGINEQEVIMTSNSSPMEWQGLFIAPGNGQILLQYVIIKEAVKGITLDQRYARLDHLLIEENGAGIHLNNSSPMISNCLIRNNRLFGIKEDGQCTPDLTNNSFSNNQAGDYYDSELTVISPEELEILNQGIGKEQ